ncbi:MAG TPA: glycosyltransferase [Balneolaceae bacterium]|nr:glycosyltransferase [Balneolaceae bacterium]
MKNLSKNIAFISEHASPLATLGGVDSGGQNVYVDCLARKLTEYGYKVDIFTRKDNSALPRVVDLCPGVRVIHIEAGPLKEIPKEQLLQYMAAFTDKMAVFIEKNEIDYKLIHAHFFMSALVAADLKQLLNIPFVVTFHALGKVRRFHQKKADKFPDSRFDIEERIMREADRLIAECPQDVHDFTNLYGADTSTITTIPCGVDLNDFYPIDKSIARLTLNFDRDEKMILQLGRMVKRKGIANVVKALAILKEKYNFRARLVIVGGGSDNPDPAITPEIGRLKKIAASLGVENQIEFTGRKNRDKLKFYYNAADVFVSTPWYEPFGMTPLESMACGTPVIGSNVGGIKYSVADGETGFHVPAKEPEMLAAKLQNVLSNGVLRDELSTNAIGRVRNKFTWDKVTTQIVRLYNEISAANFHGRGNGHNFQLVENNFRRLAGAIRKTERMLSTEILEASKVISECFLGQGKVLTCGNGGSAAEAQHLSAELVGQFTMKNRPPLPTVSLTADSAVTTALSNDFGIGSVFAQQVQALAQKNDVLIGISTSGNSINVIEAFKQAHAMGITVIGILGGDGGQAATYADIALNVPSSNTQTIQEVHMHLLHTICELVEHQLFVDENVVEPEQIEN